MKRPVRVTLSAIILGLFAALQILAALLYLVLGIVLRHTPPRPDLPQPNIPSPLPASALTAIMLVFAALLIILATWAISTLVGLLRLRNWARSSVLVIGGCLTFLGIFSIFGAAVSAAIMPATAPNLPPHTMQAILVFTLLIYAVVAGIGIWWLVYFNLRATKACFLPAYEPRYSASASLPPSTMPLRKSGRFAHIPTSIIVLACLFFLSTLSLIPASFLPVPAFLLGFTLQRPFSIALYLAFAVLTALIGIGLLRLDNRARLAAYAFMLFGVGNFAVLVTPWGQQRYAAYTQQMYASLHFPGVPSAPPPSMLMSAIIPMAFVVGLIFYGVQLWILQHHKNAFLAAPPPHA